jgi:hypothetical protein
MPFVKGKSGNPKGRPKVMPPELKVLARQYTEETTLRLVDWMRSDNPAASVSACNSLLDRAWGKAEQHHTGDTAALVINLVKFGDHGDHNPTLKQLDAAPLSIESMASVGSRDKA